MVKILTQELLAKQKPQRRIDVDLREHIHIVGSQNGQTVAEFISAGNFAQAFYERQEYEIDAGRDEVPLLYGSIYNPIVNSGLPETIKINSMGPTAVVFEQITEGGEVKFVTVGEGSKSLDLFHYAAGLEYSQKLIEFNQSWELAPVERRFGQAYNALLNHLHLNPILAYTYAAANQTAASAVGTPLWEKYLHTIEDAITNSKTDTTNPRRGPYDLIVSSANLFTVEYALKLHIQDGANPNTSSAIGMIQNIIAYDGWSGMRGKKATSYGGVSAGKAYLVSKQYAADDFKSYMKYPLRMQRGDGDLSRFIVEQIVWDTWLGVYANPVASVEEITWPTS